VLALAVPALASNTHVEAGVYDARGRLAPFGLDIESATNDTAHYNSANDATPDTVDWAKFGCVLGPTGTPVDLYVEWQTEANVTWGYVQSKAITNASGGPSAYGWGDVPKFDLTTATNSPVQRFKWFEVGLWDSARSWAAGSSDGRMAISMHATVID